MSHVYTPTHTRSPTPPPPPPLSLSNASPVACSPVPLSCCSYVMLGPVADNTGYTQAKNGSQLKVVYGADFTGFSQALASALPLYKQGNGAPGSDVLANYSMQPLGPSSFSVSELLSMW